MGRVCPDGHGCRASARRSDRNRMFESPSSARTRKSRLIPVLLALSFLLASGLRAEDATQERFEKKYDLTGTRKVRAQNVNGSIQIETGRDQLQVVAVKK